MEGKGWGGGREGWEGEGWEGEGWGREGWPRWERLGRERLNRGIGWELVKVGYRECWAGNWLERGRLVKREEVG